MWIIAGSQWFQTGLLKMDFAHKTALVTGGGSGIGAAITKNLIAHGAHVIVAQRSHCTIPNADFIRADFLDPDEPERMVDQIQKQHGNLDILVNNAGMMQESEAENLSLEDWNKQLMVNLTAPFLLIKFCLPLLRDSNGNIVNIGSIEGIGANPGHSAYCASKAGLHGLTRAIAVDHGHEGIRCNAVAPGWIDTELNMDFIESMPDPEAFRQNIGRIHPVGRTGSPEEVANLVCWLASDQASFVTGQVYTIDGGRTSKLSLPG